jgi:hypothetical protein
VDQQLLVYCRLFIALCDWGLQEDALQGYITWRIRALLCDIHLRSYRVRRAHASISYKKERKKRHGRVIPVICGYDIGICKRTDCALSIIC